MLRHVASAATTARGPYFSIVLEGIPANSANGNRRPAASVDGHMAPTSVRRAPSGRQRKCTTWFVAAAGECGGMAPTPACSQLTSACASAASALRLMKSPYVGSLPKQPSLPDDERAEPKMPIYLRSVTW